MKNETFAQKILRAKAEKLETKAESKSLQSADLILSRLVMGFVERRVSPQTIADVVLAQIFEADTKPEDLSNATCNGILEALSSSATVAGIQDILIFVSYKTEFPRFLSASATLGSLCALLVSPNLSLDPGDRNYKDLLRVLDNLAKGSVERLATAQGNVTRSAKMRLTNAFKTSHQVVSQLAQVCPHLIVLRQILLKGAEPRTDLYSQATFSSVRAVIAAITNTPDHVLVHHIPKDYLTTDVKADDIKKLDFLEDVIRTIASAQTTRFQSSFLVEWLFTGCLRRASMHHDDAATLKHALQIMIGTPENKLDVLKGIVRALQRDLSLIYTENSGTNMRSERLELGRAAAQSFFASLYSTSHSQWPWLAREFVPWVMQLPCHPPESRMVTREQIEWFKTMDTREWMEGLSKPPLWITADASHTAATVFQMAPGAWLQLYAGLFIDPLVREAISSEFVLSSSHFDFVEFLIRCMRKKSPLFASEVETLICLQILGRAHSNEQNQMKLSVTRLRLQSSAGAELREQTRTVLGLLTQPHTVEMLGPNPVARALNLLSRCCRFVEMKSKREADKKGGRVSSF